MNRFRARLTTLASESPGLLKVLGCHVNGARVVLCGSTLRPTRGGRCAGCRR